MSLREFAVAGLALLGGVHAASSCCFVVQDEAHEVYWSEYEIKTYTTAVNLTSITTLLTPYPTTTVTNYETNVYPTSKEFTTSVLMTENPVSLYTNPAYAVPQKTEILAGSVPTVTGGVTVNSPTGFWVYSTAKVFVAPAVTDSDGNVACGTLSSFSSVAADATACVPTFTAINSNAAANFDTNGGQGVHIALTTPFIHVPTRTVLQLSPSEVCAQGNGTENYGYPVQQLINHLAGNSFYSAQYPGIESCIPAGPSIQAVEALAIAVTSSQGADPPPVSTAADPPDPTSVSAAADPPSVNVTVPASSSSVCIGNCGTTETPGGGLTSSTTIIVTVTNPTSSGPSETSTTATPGSTSTTSVTSTSVPPALPASASTTSPVTSGGEAPVSGGLLPTTSSSVSSSIISPLMETSAPLSVSNTTTSQSAASSSVAPSTSLGNSTGTSTLSTSSAAASSSSVITSSFSNSSTELPSTVGIVLPGSVLLPVTTSLTGVTGPLTTISSSTFVVVSNPTTIPLVIGTGSVSVPVPTLVPASSVKESVPWKLLIGLTVVVAMGAW